MRADNTVRLVSCLVCPHIKQNSQHFIGTIKDITDEHIVKHHAENAKNILAQYANNIKMAFYQIDTYSKNISFLNQYIDKISRASIYGQPDQSSKWFSLIIKDDITNVENNYFKKNQLPVKAHEIEYKIRLDNGEIRSIVDKSFAYLDNNNNQICIFGIILDSTKHYINKHYKTIEQQFIKLLNPDKSLHDATLQALELICNDLKLDYAAIWLYDESKKSLHKMISYIKNINEQLESHDSIIQNNKDTIDGILKLPNQIYINKDPEFPGKEFKTFIISKIIHGEQCLGVINFVSKKQSNISAKTHVLLENITNLLGNYLSDVFVKSEYNIDVNYDIATGLPNQASMHNSLQQLIEDQKPQSIVIIDIVIDQLKKITQALGYEFGNELLKSIAEHYLNEPINDMCLAALLDNNSLCFVFKDMIDPKKTTKILSMLSEIQDHTLTVRNNSIFVTASIGVSIFPQDGTDANTLLLSAMQAAERASGSGGNKIEYTSTKLQEELFETVNIELSLHRAIYNNEFIMHYQPKVDLNSGLVIGAEALIRWQTPDGVLHMPNYFLHIAEESDLIITIGEWVLADVCRTIRDEDIRVPISVNFSIRQFKNKEYLLALVKKIIGEFKINPKMLEFEITESILIKEQWVIECLKEFRSMGIKISFDDFGVKYCSLTYLKNYVPDKIKIDKSFVDMVPESITGIAIIKAIVGLAKSLNIKTTVEGAEVYEQVQFFINLGCTELQSFYISKAVPIIEFKNLLNKSYKHLFVTQS